MISVSIMKSRNKWCSWSVNQWLSNDSATQWITNFHVQQSHRKVWRLNNGSIYGKMYYICEDHDQCCKGHIYLNSIQTSNLVSKFINPLKIRRTKSFRSRVHYRTTVSFYTIHSGSFCNFCVYGKTAFGLCRSILERFLLSILTRNLF